jgi:anti-sigma factor RsiW
MNCETFQKSVTENDAHELDSAEQNHLQECEQCQTFVKLDEKLVSLIRKNLAQIAVPEHLKSSLKANLNDQKNGTYGFLKWAPAMAMAGMLIFFLIPQGGSFASMDEIGQLAITDHEFHQGKSCSKGIPEDLSAWGKESIGFSITLPELPFRDYELIGVSKCRLGDCDTAHLIYERNGKRFSVFIFPEKEAAFSLHASRNYTLDFDSYQVSIWKTNTQVYALVMS